jgi:hypothetical protein
MDNRLFKVGGVSKYNGQYKVRFGVDMTSSVKRLVHSGTNTDVNLVELPTPASKSEVVTFLKASELYNNPTYREAIDTADTKYNGVGVVTTKTAKVKPSMDALKARAQAATEETAE